MSLRIKFNLILVAFFALSLLGAGIYYHRYLEDTALGEVRHNSQMLMATAMAIRGYTTEQIKPRLDPLNAQRFHPQTVPAFAATDTLRRLQDQYPGYTYKEAVLNPTNPRNRTADWEADLVQQFRQYPDRGEIVAERQTTTGRNLFIAKPIQISNPACLQCHSTPAAAPPSMLKIYGEANGFGWKHNEIVGAQVVTVPMDVPLRKAERAFTTFMISLAAVFLSVFVVLNVMLSWLIVRPIRRMSEAADKISTGDFGVPEFAEKGRDEVSVLGSSFNRMRRSLEKAIKLIEG